MAEGIWGVVVAAVWVVLLVQSAVVVSLCRSMRDLYDRTRAPDAHAVGPSLQAIVPETRVVDVAGNTLRLGGPSVKKRLLVFLSPGCPSCRSAIDQAAGVPPEAADVIL